MFEAILFYVFGGLAIGLAGAMLLLKNPIHGAIALVWNLCCVAALFTMLSASFVSVIQVMVYAGAILVLFVFVIMLLNLGDDELGKAKRTLYKVLGGLMLCIFMLAGLQHVGQAPAFAEAPLPADFGSIENMGRLLFGPLLLPFEVASVLLFAAIMGAVAISKKEHW